MTEPMTVEEIQEQQGWTDSTLLVLARKFIDKIEMEQEFEDYLQDVADEENVVEAGTLDAIDSWQQEEE